jgi:hypothetical protein
VAIVGLDFQQFAWRIDKPFTVNSRCYGCMLLHTDTGMDFSDEFVMKSDVDFMIRTLAAGWNTVLVHKYAMDTTKMGSTTTGGQADMYRAGADEQYAEKLLQLYPQYVKLVEKPDRLDARVHWRSFTQPLRARSVDAVVGIDSPA